MRLIDADALLEQYSLKDATKYGNKDAEQQAHSYGTMMLYEVADMIESAPTAYDPDKVVQQLEEQKSLVPVNRLLDDIVNEKPKELGMLIAYRKAIDIVKGGGVNG